MKHQRILSGLLAAVMCSAVLSCTTTDDTDDTTDGSTDSATDAAPETEATFDVPADLDFDGYTFRIMTNPGETKTNAFIWGNWGVNEDTGDVLETAFYNRNLWLKEYFNVDIEMDLRGGLTDTSRFSRSVTADEQFDMGIWIDRFALSLAQGGYVRPYTQLDYIDLTKPWWYQKANDQLSLDHKLYMAAGHQDIGIFACTQGLLYNTKIAADLGLGSLYDYVDAGTWTMDKMYDMEVAATQDLNGDSVMTDRDDQWGGISSGWSLGAVAANDMGFIMKDDEDKPYVTALQDERLYDILYKLTVYLENKDVCYEANSKSFYNSSLPYQSGIDMFTGNRALFFGLMFAYFNALRDMDNYGIMPFPRYEEVPAGTEYNGASISNQFYIVPKNHIRPEIPGAMLEAMAYKSYKTVSPVYLETVLTVKQTRDEKSAEIIKMITKNVSRDLIHAYWLDQLWSYIGDSTKDDMVNYVSAWTKGQKQCEKVMGDTLAAFQNMNEGY